MSEDLTKLAHMKNLTELSVADTDTDVDFAVTEADVVADAKEITHSLRGHNRQYYHTSRPTTKQLG